MLHYEPVHVTPTETQTTGETETMIEGREVETTRKQRLQMQSKREGDN